MSYLKALLMNDDKRKITRFGKRIQKLCKRLEDRWPFKHFEIVDDAALMGPRLAIEFFFERLWDRVTFAITRERLKRSWDYAKKGYMSYDFDSHHALDDFCWKLERIAKCVDTGHHVDGKNDARKIRQATYLFKRVMDDDYYQENIKPIEEKYGETVMNWEAPRDKDGSVGSTVLFGPRSKSVPADQPIIKKLEGQAMQKSIDQRQRDWKYAMGIVQKYFWHWWD
jgi:hypothetical protein